MGRRPLTQVHLGEGYTGKIRMREVLYEEARPNEKQQRFLDLASSFTYRELSAASLQRDLIVKEAFALMCYALRATNGRLADGLLRGLETFGEEGDRMAARELLSGYAMKETWAGITPKEVAGMVAATMMDVMRFPDYGPRVIETCGMGGDKGIVVDGEGKPRKTINGSTLSALVLASMGIPTAKHGSYGNTSPVGSTNAIEDLGVIVDIPSASVQQQLVQRGFHFTDAHAWKTIHDLSHLQPRRETINHVVGPMTPPISPETRLDKILGVNDKLPPWVVAEAYVILDNLGVFKVGNVAVVAGLETCPPETGIIESPQFLRANVRLDELSPAASVVSFVRGSRFLGTHLLKPGDFGVEFPDPRAPFFQTDRDLIREANLLTIRGHTDRRQLVELLAMNAALGLYLVQDMDDDKTLEEHGPDRGALRRCYQSCLDQLVSGRVYSFLCAYANHTQWLTKGVSM
jgi:anthranilate phosphoribosyltransferase